MSQQIPLEQAIAMTKLYRQQKENILAEAYKNQDILALSETFERDVIDALLASPGCARLRIYYGMDEGLKVHAILVAATDKNEDILPSAGATLSLEGNGIVVENSYRCPPDCPTNSPLNNP
jgi:hypothetical protein